MTTRQRSVDLLCNPHQNKFTAFPESERAAGMLEGLVPECVVYKPAYRNLID